jgi:hypothetical protein
MCPSIRPREHAFQSDDQRSMLEAGMARAGRHQCPDQGARSAICDYYERALPLSSHGLTARIIARDSGAHCRTRTPGLSASMRRYSGCAIILRVVPLVFSMMTNQWSAWTS